jgi:excisionase family DNA binding protein
MEQQLWRAEHVARLLDCGVKTVYAKAANGEIPSLRVGGLVRFEPDVIERWLKTQRQGPPDEAYEAVAATLVAAGDRIAEAGCAP